MRPLMVQRLKVFQTDLIDKQDDNEFLIRNQNKKSLPELVE